MNTRRLGRSVLCSVLLLSGAVVGCDGPTDPDAGMDVPDAGHDAGLPDVDAGGLDGGADDAGPQDAGPPDAGPPVPVDVSHPRELRAMWLTTAFRLDFPSRTDLTEADARSELGAIAETTRAAGLNAILFQVRPEGDAFYQSTLEPWSRFLTGTQGVDPGYDPLALLLEEAHSRGIEVHAWLNPFRGLTSDAITPAAGHAAARFPESAIAYNGAVTMDPSAPDVRAHIVAVVTDVVSRYDVDGVVFDDYFYPYPAADGSPFPDEAQYLAYVDGGGILSKSDWRRDNINRLIEAVGGAIRTTKPHVRWGVAPFGIYRPGMPAGVTGLDAYEVLATDPLHWLDQGWVDYLAPQLYWPTTSSGQPFGALVEWWAARAPAGRPIVPSLALYRLGSTSDWTPAELEAQVALTRALGPETAGQTWFRHAFLRDDAMGERDLFVRTNAVPARPPVVPATQGEAVEPPEIEVVAGGLTLAHPAREAIGGFAVYRWTDPDWTMERWLPSSATSVALSTGTVAVSAITRGGEESRGVRVTLP